MSPLGLKICEWLQSQDDVSLVRDDSDARGEALTCCHGGAAYRVLLSRGPANGKIPDYRTSGREDDW